MFTALELLHPAMSLLEYTDCNFNRNYVKKNGSQERGDNDILFIYDMHTFLFGCLFWAQKGINMSV